MSVLADSAKAYAQTEGLYVFPLKEHGKTPLTSHGLDDATTDALTIETWWGRWPDANIAIRTGDLVVIDEDHLGALLELAQKQHEHIPETRIAKTGKGRHYYFTQPPGQRIRNTAGKLAPGVDTRGDGGYVVAPPSIHPDGGVYAWESTAPPAQLPSWIAALLTKPEPRPAEPYLGRSTPYGQRALEAELHVVATAIEGTRNDRLNTAAFALGQLIAGGELDAHDARISINAAARACGLPDHEAEQTIASGLSAGLSSPRTAPERPAPSTTQTPKADLALVPKPESRITVEPWQTFNRNSQAELEFLIADLWPTKSFAFIASPPKKGKTWLGLAAAISIATGKTFAASFDIPEPRRVLYLALEGARAAIRARIGALARGLNLDPDSDELDLLDISYRPRGINLADPEWAAELTNIAAEHEYAVIIVDVLRNAAQIKEGDQAEFSRLRMLLEPALAHTSIALLHHFTKLSEISKERTPAERMSGSGAMYGALDVGLFITGSEDHARKLRVEFEGRDIAMPDPTSIYLEGQGAGPNGSLLYTDTAFWRGDIDEVLEADVQVPSVVVIDIVRAAGSITRRDLVDAVSLALPEAKERTIIHRIEQLANAKPATLVRLRKGVYALRADLAYEPVDNSVETVDNPDTSQSYLEQRDDAQIVHGASDSLNQADTGRTNNDAQDETLGVDIPLNQAENTMHNTHIPTGLDTHVVRGGSKPPKPDDDIPF